MSEIVWRLPQLWKESGLPQSGHLPDLPIRHITDDSRHVREESVFVAVKGSKADGHRFILKAIAQGCRVLLVEEEVPAQAGVFQVKVPSTRECLGPLAHAFFGSPSKQLRVVGVTGTNGKTTVAWLIRHLLEQAGIPCGLMGTVCHRVGEEQLPSENTTPGALTLQMLLRSMVEEGLRVCSMEVSSHALDQRRTDGIEWRCAVFTNLSPEHLDYHGTLPDYLQAKLRLFGQLSPAATAVINQDDPSFHEVRAATRAAIRTFGFEQPADLTLSDIHFSLHETLGELVTKEGSFPIHWRMAGRHNLENLLAALGAVEALGVPLAKAVSGIESFSGVPGRLEQVAQAENPFPVFVDYAHTDGALRRVLGALRSVTTRKILLVFGCGGDRDRAKRPRMGRVAAELSDRVIVTSDNPRSEDPAAIAQEVSVALQGASTPWQVILDRREAIRTALESADERWLVLIAGKGHETGQILRDRVVPFDDREVAREFLRESEQVVR